MRSAQAFEEFDDTVNEPLSRLNSGYRFWKRHGGVRPNLVIGNGLEVINLRQEPREFDADARITPRYPGELGVNTLVRLGYLTTVFEDERCAAWNTAK
jgi:hypothetical protein